MRRKTGFFSLLAILSVILVCSVVFASGAFDASTIPLFSTPVEPDQEAGGTVFVDPVKIIKDYVNDPGYAIGDVFPVHVNITGVTTGIYTYAINLTWNPSVLNFTRIVSYGDFLYQTESPNKTSRIEQIFDANNVTGAASIAETILGDYPGVTGSGRLFTVEFEVVGYGYSNFVIDNGAGAGLPTELLDANGANMAFSTSNGYFRNVLFGDANLDGSVNVFDVLKVKSHRSGPPPGPEGYLREADINDDGSINVFDILIVKENLGRTLP